MRKVEAVAKRERPIEYVLESLTRELESASQPGHACLDLRPVVHHDIGLKDRVAESQDLLERGRCNSNAPGLASQVSMGIEIRECRFPVPLLGFPVRSKKFPVRVRREFVCNFADLLWNLRRIGLCDGLNHQNSLFFPC